MSWYWLAAVAAVICLGLMSRRGERPASKQVDRGTLLRPQPPSMIYCEAGKRSKRSNTFGGCTESILRRPRTRLRPAPANWGGKRHEASQNLTRDSSLCSSTRAPTSFRCRLPRPRTGRMR